jgi:hypothetical protein
VSPIRVEWDAMMAEYEGDNNHDHFQRTEQFAQEVAEIFSQVSPELRKEFLEFLITLGDLGVLGLHPLQRDPEERSQPGHQGIDALHGA